MIHIEYEDKTDNDRIAYQIIDDEFVGIVTMVDTNGKITQEYNIEKYHDVYHQHINVAILNSIMLMNRIPSITLG